MSQDPRSLTLHMLANLQGGTLALDMYEHSSQGKSKLGQQELEDALRSLVLEGLAAAIFERLDGPLFTLSERGRKEMAAQGYSFDENKVERTRQLFKANFCKTAV